MYDFTNAPTKNAKGGAMKLCDIQWKHHIPHRVHKQLRKLFITAFIDYPDLVLKECSKKAAKLKFSQNLQTWFTEHDDEKAQDDVDDDDVDDHAEACTTWMAALTRMSPGERYRYAQLLRQSVLKSAKIDKQDPVGSVARMQELLLDGDDATADDAGAEDEMPAPEDEHEFVLAPGEAERGVIPDHGEDEVEEVEDYDPFQHYVQFGSNPSIPLELSNHLRSLTI